MYTVIIPLAFAAEIPLLLLAVVLKTRMKMQGSDRDPRFRPGLKLSLRRHELKSTSQHTVPWACLTLLALQTLPEVASVAQVFLASCRDRFRENIYLNKTTMRNAEC